MSPATRAARVLRLMRESGLLAPVRRGHPRGDRTHGGRIRTERPDELRGTDASRFRTKVKTHFGSFGKAIALGLGLRHDWGSQYRAGQHLHDFDTLEEARAVIEAFIERYNNGWLLQRHGYVTPGRAREKLSRRAA